MARSGLVFGVALCALALERSALAQASAVAAGSGTTAQSDRAGAAARRVVLLDATESLAVALRTALTPWGLRLESSERRTPEASLPAAALGARQLARELEASALVWLTADAQGAALWLYEAARDSVRVRSFPDRPLDGALAAAMALSVKTWLRSEDDAPARVEAPAALAGARSEPSEPARALSISERASTQAEVSAAARSRLLVHAEARAGALQDAGVEARYGLELRAAAWRSDDRSTSLWLAAHVDAGEPHAVREAVLHGDYVRWGGGMSLGVGQRLAGAWSAQLLAAMTVERARLSGTLLPDGVAIERSRWQAVAHLRPELELALAPVGFVLQPTLSAAPAQQRYLVGGIEVLSTRALWWSLGGAVSVELF